MRILRHNFEVTDYQELVLPTGAAPLSAAQGRDDKYTLDLWYIDPEYQSEFAGKTKFGLYVIGTGNSMPEDLDPFGRQLQGPNAHFLSTVVTDYGAVWHVFLGANR